MQFDHIAEKKHDNYFARWVTTLLNKNNSTEGLAIQLAGPYVGPKQKEACQWENGAFNVCYRVRYCDDGDNGTETIVRFSALGRTIFRSEKIDNEVAAFQFLRKYTAIPVPEVYATGKATPRTLQTGVS